MSEPLERLTTLDRDRLHLFVAGPGVGEAIALALPGGGWVLIDGCRVEARAGSGLPLRDVLQRWQGDNDPVLACVFTHPHADHAAGIAELLEEYEPRQVCVAGACSPKRDIFELARDAASADSRRAVDYAEFRLAGEVLNALQAIRTWEERTGRAVAPWYDGLGLSLSRQGLSLTVRAPQAAEIRAFFRKRGAAQRLRTRANELSLVLEVRYGATALVLGGDLPTTRGGTPVASGWGSVMGRHPGLSSHDGLKVPHHGSAEASHASLNPHRGAGERAWVVTPYNPSGLPRLGAGEGGANLLKYEPRLLLTALPADLAHGGAAEFGRTVRLRNLHKLAAARPTGNAFIDGGRDRLPATPAGPLDAIWCVAFDDASRIRGLWGGAHAVELRG